jgi:hypothetical protein
VAIAPALIRGWPGARARLEADRVERLAARLDPDVTDHLVPAELVEGQREDERLRDRLDGEGELGISGGDDAAGRSATATAVDPALRGRVRGCSRRPPASKPRTSSRTPSSNSDRFHALTISLRERDLRDR